MKKHITPFLFILSILLFVSNASFSQDVLLRFNSKPASGTTSFTFSTGDILYPVDASTMSGSNSNTCFASPNNVRVQLKEIILELKSTSASAISVHGMSSGATSTRTIYKVSVADSKNGTYALLDDVTLANTKITSTIDGQAACGTSTVTGLHIAKGKFVKIIFCTGKSGGDTQNVNISGFDITPASTSPEVVLTTGNTPVEAMELIEITPVVYTYRNVADDNNVVFGWYTDKTYSANAVAPANLSLTKNTETKTLHLAEHLQQQHRENIFTK
jgi:hypothetical protein